MCISNSVGPDGRGVGAAGAAGTAYLILPAWLGGLLRSGTVVAATTKPGQADAGAHRGPTG